MEQQFDASSFLDQAVKGAMDTKIIPPPAGGPYQGTIEKVDVKRIAKKDGTGYFYPLECLIKITDANVAKATGREFAYARFSTFLDLDANGKIDKNPQKNVKLGQIREATGLNDPKREFSIRQLTGLPIAVHVKHDVQESGDVYANVSAVEKAAR